MAKPKVTEVIFWQNGNMMAFRKNGRQVPECQIGCILSPELIKKLNEYCDKDTKFYMAIYSGNEGASKRYEMDISWWFKRKEEANNG